MPVTYEIDVALALIRTRCTGQITLDEVLTHFDVLERDPLCPKRLDVLLDLTEMSSLPQPDQLRSASQRIRTCRVEFRACAVVTASTVLFGLARMFEVFASAAFSDIRVFRELEPARSWLFEYRLVRKP